MARVTTGLWGRNPEGKWGPLPFQPGEKLAPAIGAAMSPPKAGGFGRLMQGMVKWGGKFAPALGAAKAAGPAIGGAAQGLGMGAGFEAGRSATKGIGGWLSGFLPENVYGWFMLSALLIYWFELISGFNTAATAEFRIWFAIVAFFIIGFVGHFLSGWVLLSASFLYFSLVGLLGADSLMERALSIVVLVVSIIILNLKAPQVPGFYKLMPLITFLDIFGISLLTNKFVEFGLGINYVVYAVAFVTDRMFFPVWLWFGMLSFSGEGVQYRTRVAGRFLFFTLVFYLIAALPALKEAYNEKVSALPPEVQKQQQEQRATILARFQAGLQRVLSGEFLRTPVASAYERAELAFGFGEAKEEPKMGLQIRDDPNMPKEFNLEFYDAPTPSVIMEVPNPLPTDDPAKRAIKVVDIDCEDKTTGTSNWKVVEPSPEPTAEQPVLVSYRRPRTAKCEFPDLKEGSQSVEIKVKYAFEADAELATAFMRSDKLEALIAAGEDPAVINKIPPASAEYDNGPVAITWGPVELVTSPASVDLAGAKSSLVVYVAKSGSWDGEIDGISSLELTVPQGAELVPTDDKKCAFEKVSGASDTYKVKEGIILKVLKDDKTSRFVGDGIQFACKMKVDSKVLSGADWAGAQFKVHVSYVFSTAKTVSFEVKGQKTSPAPSQAPATTEPTLQQIECEGTGGVWHKTICDCGAGKKWDASAGCV